MFGWEEYGRETATGERYHTRCLHFPDPTGEAEPSARLQGFADGLALLAELTNELPADLLTAYMESLVVSLTEMAGELAGIELWAGVDR